MKNSNALNEIPPSDWITYRMSPDRFYSGEGVGFSALAEPYLNFGMIGVVVYFILLGAYLAWMDSIVLLSSPRRLVFACITMWPLCQTVRNDFGNLIKPAVFALISLLVWRVVAKAVPFISRKYRYR